MITVIGAGPAGLRTAELVAKQGQKVVVLEEHPTIGLPVQCTGIVTQSLADTVPFKKEFVMNRLRNVVVHSPDGNKAEIGNNDVVIDRARFDQHLARRAEKAGAKILLNKRVEGIAQKGKILLKVKDVKTGRHLKHKTDILIGADGPGSIVSRHIGNPRPAYWIGKQARVKMPVEKDAYHVHFGKQFPTFFGWAVPESENTARVGVAATRNVDVAFKRLMQHVGRHKVLEMQGGVIPKYNPYIKVQKGNIYLVGDAATQVKATTGGGLVPGMKAAECLARAIKDKTDYRAELAAVNRELRTHLWIRNIMDRFNDEDYNRLVRILNKQSLKKALQKHDRDHAIRILLSILVREPGLLLFSKVLFRPKQA